MTYLIPVCRILVACTLTAAAVNAQAHAGLQQATPAAGAVLSGAPDRLTLRFSEKLESVFSSVKLVDGSGNPVETGRASVDSAQPSVMTLALPALKPGIYTVRWTVVGQDGHRRQGDYRFTVK
jgi:methionine-rich copper-binding protein CopC